MEIPVAEKQKLEIHGAEGKISICGTRRAAEARAGFYWEVDWTISGSPGILNFGFDTPPCSEKQTLREALELQHSWLRWLQGATVRDATIDALYNWFAGRFRSDGVGTSQPIFPQVDLLHIA